MSTQLTLIETSDFEADRIVQENQVIDEALHILDRRLFARGPNLTSPDAVASYLKLHLAQQEHEVFGVIFLDAKHRVLAFEVLFHGSIDGASVYPRQVVKRSLAHNAAAAIFVHNHPSGCTEPSQADRVLTARLKETLALIEVRVLDHFIIGEGRPLPLPNMAGFNPHRRLRAPGSFSSWRILMKPTTQAQPLQEAPNPFVRGYDNLRIERLLLITYANDCPPCFRPVHDSQAHLPDDALQLFPCVFSDDFALISEGQSIPEKLDERCPSTGLVRQVIYAVTGEMLNERHHPAICTPWKKPKPWSIA